MALDARPITVRDICRLHYTRQTPNRFASAAMIDRSHRRPKPSSSLSLTSDHYLHSPTAPLPRPHLSELCLPVRSSCCQTPFLQVPTRCPLAMTIPPHARENPRPPLAQPQAAEKRGGELTEETHGDTTRGRTHVARYSLCLRSACSSPHTEEGTASSGRDTDSITGNMNTTGPTPRKNPQEIEIPQASSKIAASRASKSITYM